MEEPVRISPEEARDRTTSGLAKLICAYEDELKCKKIHLEGAISLKAFRYQLSSLPKDQDLIFYCA